MNNLSGIISIFTAEAEDEANIHVLTLNAKLFLGDDLNNIFITHNVVDSNSLWTKFGTFAL